MCIFSESFFFGCKKRFVLRWLIVFFWTWLSLSQQLVSFTYSSAPSYTVVFPYIPFLSNFQLQLLLCWGAITVPLGSAIALVSSRKFGYHSYYVLSFLSTFPMALLGFLFVFIPYLRRSIVGAILLNITAIMNGASYAFVVGCCTDMARCVMPPRLAPLAVSLVFASNNWATLVGYILSMTFIPTGTGDSDPAEFRFILISIFAITAITLLGLCLPTVHDEDVSVHVSVRGDVDSTAQLDAPSLVVVPPQSIILGRTSQLLTSSLPSHVFHIHVGFPDSESSEATLTARSEHATHTSKSTQGDTFGAGHYTHRADLDSESRSRTSGSSSYVTLSHTHGALYPPISDDSHWNSPTDIQASQPSLSSPSHAFGMPPNVHGNVLHASESTPLLPNLSCRRDVFLFWVRVLTRPGPLLSCLSGALGASTATVWQTDILTTITSSDTSCSLTNRTAAILGCVSLAMIIPGALAAGPLIEYGRRRLRFLLNVSLFVLAVSMVFSLLVINRPSWVPRSILRYVPACSAWSVAPACVVIGFVFGVIPPAAVELGVVFLSCLPPTISSSVFGIFNNVIIGVIFLFTPPPWMPLATACVSIIAFLFSLAIPRPICDHPISPNVPNQSVEATMDADVQRVTTR